MNQSIDKDRLKSFAEFWPYYICEHTHPVNRAPHFAGSTLGLVCLIATLVAGNLWFISLGLVIGYGFAWTGPLLHRT